jgi:hypothetical protein
MVSNVHREFGAISYFRLLVIAILIDLDLVKPFQPSGLLEETYRLNREYSVIDLLDLVSTAIIIIK